MKNTYKNFEDIIRKVNEASIHKLEIKRQKIVIKKALYEELLRYKEMDLTGESNIYIHCGLSMFNEYDEIFPEVVAYFMKHFYLEIGEDSDGHYICGIITIN